MDVETEVYEIRDKCPMHKAGGKIVIDGPKIVLEKTSALCTHALATLLYYVFALNKGTDPVKLGLTKEDDREHAYMQCVDLWKRTWKEKQWSSGRGK